jgi:NADH dehydrogenase [ubiquinone] 1 alpha subcomplex assembly factor 7
VSPAPLLRELRALIAAEGPIGVDRYMALCLGHPVHGYYRTRDPLGAAGDFTTAPEISQMFGELIGLWAATVWDGIGRPERFQLVELGPGRGTLMRDALRAIAAAAPACRAALDLNLVETSPVLRAAQAERLREAEPTWHDDVAELPAGPAIVIANEFFDALPARQLVRDGGAWRERMVGLDGERLVFGLAAEPARDVEARAPDGTVLTLGRAAAEVAAAIAARLVRWGGALLAVDYGHDRPGFGDTLQAVAGHRFADPLDAPGEADLTVHVDFSALARAVGAVGAVPHGPVPQGDFLRALGIEQRAGRLVRDASPAQAAAVEAARDRLLDDRPRGMGRLFRVLGAAPPGLPLPGFAPPAIA